MSNDNKLHEAEQIARLFHDTYERLAPAFGYETRVDTKEFNPSSPNGRLMIAVCGEVVSAIAALPAEKPAAAALKRGSTGICVRSNGCSCEREGLGDECVWLRPATPPAAAAERGAVTDELICAIWQTAPKKYSERDDCLTRARALLATPPAQAAEPAQVDEVTDEQIETALGQPRYHLGMGKPPHDLWDFNQIKAALAALTQRPAAPLAADAGVVQRIAELSTFRPVALLYGVTMHRDVRVDEFGWLRRSDVLEAFADTARLGAEADHALRAILEAAGEGATVADVLERLAAHPAAVEVPAQRDEQGEK